jgi:hypothetical protein
LLVTGGVRQLPWRVRREHLVLHFTANHETNTNFDAGLPKTRAAIRALRGSPC